jgi:hypothetical protein
VGKANHYQRKHHPQGVRRRGRQPCSSNMSANWTTGTERQQESLECLRKPNQTRRFAQGHYSYQDEAMMQSSPDRQYLPANWSGSSPPVSALFNSKRNDSHFSRNLKKAELQAVIPQRFKLHYSVLRRVHSVCKDVVVEMLAAAPAKRFKSVLAHTESNQHRQDSVFSGLPAILRKN